MKHGSFHVPNVAISLRNRPHPQTGHTSELLRTVMPLHTTLFATTHSAGAMPTSPRHARRGDGGTLLKRKWCSTGITTHSISVNAVDMKYPLAVHPLGYSVSPVHPLRRAIS